MSDPRQDAAHVRREIEARMEALRLSQSDLARATGLSEKTIYNLLSTDNGMKRKTKWALCDALGWTQDSIDRLYAGEEPQLVDVDATPANVKRLPSVDQQRDQDNVRTDLFALGQRLSALELQANEGFAAVFDHDDRLDELTRQLRLLAEKVDRLGQPGTRGEAGES